MRKKVAAYIQDIIDCESIMQLESVLYKASKDWGMYPKEMGVILENKFRRELEIVFKDKRL